MGTANNRPFVSVIVPVYKVEKYIETCLNSLINQTYANWEAILVDDGSPDHSGEICDEFSTRDGRFKIFHKENGGSSSARNHGITKASGDFIFYLDSDDFLHVETLKHLTDLACKFNADIVQCGFVRGNETSFPPALPAESIAIYDNKTIFTDFAAKIIPWGKLYRKSIFDDIRFPVGFINEDDFTIWKFYYNAKKIVVTNQKLYYYTINPKSIMASQKRKPNLNYFNAYKERIEFFENKGENDLVSVSRIQWMKSLVMMTSNKNLSEIQYREIRQVFKDNFQRLRKSKFKYPFKLKTIFMAYNILPNQTGRIVNAMYKRWQG